MKAFLVHKNLNFDAKAALPPNAADLTQDLELETLVRAMSNEDEYLAGIARGVLLQATATDLETVLYRQAVWKDCLANRVTVEAIYKIALDSIEPEKRNSWAYFSNYPAGTLRRSLEIMNYLVELLSRLRSVADHHAGEFKSQGFTDLFATLKREIDDGYFVLVRDHLQELKFDHGVMIGARLGQGNKGIDYLLLRSKEPKLSWIERLFASKRPGYTFTLHPRDEGGARALSELADRGIDQVADALARSADHIVSFFMMLRSELGFYMGCLNLYDHLTEKKLALCLPKPSYSDTRLFRFEGLYDLCLALKISTPPVANDDEFRTFNLVMITGANQGGKSTFLRGLGIAQLMMQAGMFVPAHALAAPLSEGIFTHYKREEDTTMRSGKFDEELVRMSAILDEIHPHALMLFNESFAATNEREGSDIAAQIVRGLLVRKIRVVFVTHMYELANAFFGSKIDGATYLRADRTEDGHRSFKLARGEPLRTSYGQDLYDKTFAGTKLPPHDVAEASMEILV
jgi:DNA mismatch repair ATPase MutS